MYVGKVHICEGLCVRVYLRVRLRVHVLTVSIPIVWWRIKRPLQQSEHAFPVRSQKVPPPFPSLPLPFSLLHPYSRSPTGSQVESHTGWEPSQARTLPCLPSFSTGTGTRPACFSFLHKSQSCAARHQISVWDSPTVFQVHHWENRSGCGHAACHCTAVS